MGMRGFVDRPCIDELRLDVSSFFTDPAGFAYRLRSSGGGAKDVQHISEILTERGVIFMSLGQPARALRDLECAADLGDELAVPEAALVQGSIGRLFALPRTAVELMTHTFFERRAWRRCLILD